MTTMGDPGRRGLVARVQGVLLRPTPEWHVIDAEPATIGSLFTGYAMILAAIGPVCSLLGTLLFGAAIYTRSGLPLPVVPLVINAVVGYVVGLIGTYIYGVIINAMAPTFGGVKEPTKAMKVAVYSGTAVWVAGVFGLLPVVGGLLIFLGLLYSIFLLYRGLPILMRSPQGKAAGYAAVVVLITLLVNIILGAIVFGVGMSLGAYPNPMAAMHPAVAAGY